MIGTSVTRTPVAWATALATAAGVGTTPISPMPLAPYGPAGSCPSSRTARISGRSEALGAAYSSRLALTRRPCS